MHMQGLHLICVLVSLGTGGTEVKNAWMSAMGLVLLRASLRGSEVSSRSMTWMSVCFPKLSMVSIGLRVFAFFVAGPSESSLMLMISGKVDVDGVLTRVAGFPVLQLGDWGKWSCPVARVRTNWRALMWQWWHWWGPHCFEQMPQDDNMC